MLGDCGLCGFCEHYLDIVYGRCPVRLVVASKGFSCFQNTLEGLEVMEGAPKPDRMVYMVEDVEDGQDFGGKTKLPKSPQKAESLTNRFHHCLSRGQVVGEEPDIPYPFHSSPANE